MVERDKKNKIEANETNSNSLLSIMCPVERIYVNVEKQCLKKPSQATTDRSNVTTKSVCTQIME